jgi:hypothetical protein
MSDKDGWMRVYSIKKLTTKCCPPELSHLIDGVYYQTSDVPETGFVELLNSDVYSIGQSPPLIV